MDSRHSSLKSRRSEGDLREEAGREKDYGESSKPPVSRRDVEMCMEELESKMKRSKKSPEKNIKLEGVNPSKEEAPNVLFDYRRAGNESFVGARFIFECGIKLELNPTTIATAAALYHRFFSKTLIKTYDVCTIGATSLFIACKVESEKRKIRDFINVVQQTIERDAELLDMDENYFNYKNGIVQTELLMLRVLEFQVTYTHPHRYLVHYLRELQHWLGYDAVCDSGMFRTAWSLLQDFHHDSSVINYKPQELAVAAIDIALQCFGTIVPGDKLHSKKSWRTVFYPDFEEDLHEKLMMKMLEVYEKEMEYIPGLVYRPNVDIKVESLGNGVPGPVPPPAPVITKPK